MDFRQTNQPNNSGRPAVTSPLPEMPEQREEKTSSVKRKTPSWLQSLNIVVLIGIAILLAGTAMALTRGNTNADSSENAYVSASKYQAIFLNNGQVYFGNVATMNNDYLRLTNVYYLIQNSEASNSDYTLQKLGCQQIHDPYDAMVINRSQVSFWENLQDDGKVVSGIKQFIKENPNGPDCSKVSTQTQSSTNTTQGTDTTTKK